MTILTCIPRLVCDEDEVTMAVNGLVPTCFSHAGAPLRLYVMKSYLSPIWPTLRCAISPILFASPPWGAFDNVIVSGATFGGRCGRSCARQYPSRLRSDPKCGRRRLSGRHTFLPTCPKLSVFSTSMRTMPSGPRSLRSMAKVELWTRLRGRCGVTTGNAALGQKASRQTKTCVRV